MYPFILRYLVIAFLLAALNISYKYLFCSSKSEVMLQAAEKEPQWPSCTADMFTPQSRKLAHGLMIAAFHLGKVPPL